MAATVSMSWPTPAATGATYFMVSPSMYRLVLDRVKAPVSTSPTRFICSAGSLNPVRMFEPMSAV